MTPATGATVYDQTLALLNDGEYNLAVSCFIRTIEREMNVVDFSWKTFTSGLCLLQPRKFTNSNVVSAFLSHENVSLFASLFLAIFLFSNLVWQVTYHGSIMLHSHHLKVCFHVPAVSYLRATLSNPVALCAPHSDADDEPCTS